MGIKDRDYYWDQYDSIVNGGRKRRGAGGDISFAGKVAITLVVVALCVGSWLFFR